MFGGYAGFSNIFVENLAPASGNQHLKMFGAFNGPFNVSGFVQGTPTSPGEVWVGKIKMMTPGNDAVAGTDNFAELHIEFYDANGCFVSGENFKTSEKFTGATPTDQYIEFSAIAEAPPGTAEVRFVGFFFNVNYNGGAIFYDDASLQKVINPLKDVSITVCPGETNGDVTIPEPSFQDESGIASTSNNITGGTTLSGTYPIGTWPVLFTVQDNDGLSNSCTVNVTVEQMPDPLPYVVCNDQVNASLDENGQAEILPDMVLEGGPYDCDDKYEITIKDHKGDPLPSNIVTCNEIGEDLTYSIEYTLTGSSCWGYLVVEDKKPPVLNCINRTIPCTSTLNQAPKPVAKDNCDNNPTEKLLSTEFIDQDACDDNHVAFRRVWIAVDDYGNESAPCADTIFIERPAVVDFPNDRTWNCNDFGKASPNFSGKPAGIDGLYCQYGYTYSDEELGLCGDAPGVKKIIRTWTVLDWCTGQVIVTGVGGEDNKQLIKFEDNTPPVITVADITISANVPGAHPQLCKGRDILPTPQTADDCSGVANVKTFTPIGETVNGWIPQPGLEIGTYTIKVTAEDRCGNISEATYTLTVVDNLAPTAICDEITDVNVSSDGLAEVSAEVFDDGSQDNCCIDRFEAAKMSDPCGISGTAFAPTVTFCCSDVPNNPVMVTMRVWDCYGNYNDCMVEVNVQDKQTPVLTHCPGPQVIDCDFYWENIETGLNLGDYSVLDQFGTAEFVDNCDLTIDQNVNVNIDQCGNGTITRTWQAKDPANNGPATCTQIISVRHISDFVVSFPEDKKVTCTDEVPDFGEPVVTNETCELIAVSYEDTYFDAVPDVCYKISRTWTVINWCVVGDDVDQEVTEVPENQLGLPFPNCDLDGDGDCDGLTFRDSWNGAAFPGVAEGIANNNQAPDTDPDLDPWDGYITYQQNIKVIDNVKPVFADGCDVPDVCIEDNTCAATVTLPQPDVTDCSTDITLTAESDLGTGFSFDGVAPGTYTVTYTASDNCGNTNSCQTTFEVKDCKKPTPYCKNGLVIELMNTTPPMVEVWASDFNENSFDNCTASNDLLISFSSDVNDKSRTYNCDQVGTQVVDVWVTDEAGNQDFCTTVVVIQDNMGGCPTGDPLVQLGGAITNEADQSIENVEVNLSGTGNGLTMTDASGVYQFADVPMGGDYTVVPSKDINPLNGVSTYDLVLITKHILGVNKLDSPYKLIAADINKSESITTFDLVQLRKLILHVDDNFQNNTSWRFVDKNFVFPNPENPFETTFPELININNLDTDELNANFIGIKIGDVNGNASPLDLTSAEDRNVEDYLVLSARDMELKAGQTYTVDFAAKDFNVTGFQFTLNFDPAVIQLDGIEEGLATEENFGMTLLDEGALTSSWHNANAVRLANDQAVFSIRVTAKADARLSDVLDINSRYTTAEAYTENGEVLGVQLHFDGNQPAGRFEVYQNTPNPFRESTKIGFQLPEATAATITFTDVSGKVLKVIEGDFAKGYNEVVVSKNDLSANGVIYYQVETATDNASGKMILIK
ncbi:MAG: HYR domain-containing protein [Bacteroidetes bacterium]|nr:MAG: HYR domain-containing protein [Bacteroidota bacterium]